eukprot:XP_003965929.2 PREDICTED: protein FAM198A [Takifugu rubripes]
MAWKLWSKVCCGQKWLLLLYPAFLLFLMVSVMTVTLPLPLPPFDIDQRLSRSLSSTGDFRPRSRAAQLRPAALSLPPPAHVNHQASDAWRSPSKHPIVPDNGKKRADTRRSSVSRNKHKAEKTAGADRHPNGRLGLPEWTGSNKEPQQRKQPGSHSQREGRRVQAHVERKSPDPNLQVNTRASDTQAGKQQHGRTDVPTDRHAGKTLAEQNRRHPGKSDAVGKRQLAVEKPLGDLKKCHNPSEDSTREKPASLEGRKPLLETDAARNGGDGGVCTRISEHDLSDADRRRVRISPALRPLPWLSEDDVQKMVFLAGGEVVSKAKLPAHGQVLQVALAPNPQLMRAGDGVAGNSSQDEREHRRPESHDERCQRGFCSLVKRTDDWFEVFAFHLDRVLGLNRSLPAVLRTFQSQILPYRYISGVPRPVVWWDPDIQHLANRDNDQNSVPLSWVQYQELLQIRCGIDVGLWSAPCVGIHHSEWGRLGLFDFLLQVNDRLDRYCCGFSPDPTELCVENMLRTRCGNTKDLLLVHILVRRADPSRLVFIDNSGRPHQSIDNLNFRLVEGINEFPERAVSVLQSGCLESLLLHSLYTDREFWESQGGAEGLRPLIRSVERRGKILLQHIRDKDLQLKRDL